MAKAKQQDEGKTRTILIEVPIREIPEDESSYALSYQGSKIPAIRLPPEQAATWRRIVYAMRCSHETLPSGRHVDTGADTLRLLIDRVHQAYLGDAGK